MLLPYIEQAPLYNAINFTNTGDVADATNGTNPNLTVSGTRLSVFVCPSDQDRLVNIQGHNNYVMNCGSDAASPEVITQTAGIGVSLYAALARRYIGLQSIIDGTSNTAAFSEVMKGSASGTLTPSLDSLIPTTSITKVSGFSGISTTDYNLCKNAGSITPATSGNMSGDWPFGVYWHSTQRSNGHYKHVMPPNSWSCQDPGNLNLGAFTASSHHSGGVNVLMCDGSVKFVKSTVSPQTWWAVGTRAANEVLLAADAL